jgi:hypothetical protein
MATLTRSFAKQCSTQAAVHKIDCEGDPVVQKNMVFYDVGPADVMRRLLQKVEELPVSRGTDDHPLGELSADRAWLSAGSPESVAWRDFAPGGLLAHAAATEGMPLCVDFFRGGLRTNGSHKNVYMFRYSAEAGHHNKMHPDHGATTQEQVSNLQAHAKLCGGQRIIIKCTEEGCPSHFCVRSSIDSQDIVVYELPVDRVTAIVCNGVDLDVIEHGFAGVLKGAVAWTVIIDLLGECGLDAVLELEVALHETKKSSVVLPKMDVLHERSLQVQHRVYQSDYRRSMLTKPAPLPLFRMHTQHGGQTLPIFPHVRSMGQRSFGFFLERGGRALSIGGQIGLDTSGWAFGTSSKAWLQIEFLFDSNAVGDRPPNVPSFFDFCRIGGPDQMSTLPRAYKVSSKDVSIQGHLTMVGSKLFPCQPMSTVCCENDDDLRREVQRHLLFRSLEPGTLWQFSVFTSTRTRSLVTRICVR